MLDNEKIAITNELNNIINELDYVISNNPDNREKIEEVYNKYKPRMEILCAKYQDVHLPEIDALEFHETYSEEYKNNRKEEYLDLPSIDRQLYRSYVMASNYEYYVLELIDKLSGEEVKEVGKDVLENLKKLFNEMDNSSN
jgi:hypothetical protein